MVTGLIVFLNVTRPCVLLVEQRLEKFSVFSQTENSIPSIINQVANHNKDIERLLEIIGELQHQLLGLQQSSLIESIEYCERQLSFDTLQRNLIDLRAQFEITRQKVDVIQQKNIAFQRMNSIFSEELVDKSGTGLNGLRPK